MSNRKFDLITKKHKYYHPYTLALLISIFNTQVLAQNDSWKCQAEDSKQKVWIANSDYELTALNKAYDACKKESLDPSSCHVSRNDCEGSGNGFSTRPMWACIAFDSLAFVWEGNSYKNGYDAALGAKAFCQSRSVVPDTCYVNLLTCKNVNINDE